MDYVLNIKPPSYVSYAPTPDVTDLRFIDVIPMVIVILLNINCLVQKLTSHDITLYLCVCAMCNNDVISSVLLSRSPVKT